MQLIPPDAASAAAALPHELLVSFSEGAVAGTRKLLDLNLERDLQDEGDLIVNSATLEGDEETFALDVTRSTRDPRRIR